LAHTNVKDKDKLSAKFKILKHYYKPDKR